MVAGRGADIKGFITLMLSVIASLISLGGIAYAAGTLTTRVDNNTAQLANLDKTNERLATIEAQLKFLVDSEKDKQNDRRDYRPNNR